MPSYRNTFAESGKNIYLWKESLKQLWQLCMMATTTLYKAAGFKAFMDKVN